jgi:hypothetical protein
MNRANNWKDKFTQEPPVVALTPDLLVSFTDAIQTVETLMNIAPVDRTPTMTAQLRADTNELTALMRNIKRRFIFSPPLTDTDLLSLGLQPKDTTPTAVGLPQGLVTASVKYLQERALELGYYHVENTPTDKRANYGIKTRYAVFPPEVTAIENIGQLTETAFTRQKKMTFKFGDADRRKVAWFRMRYENSKGEAGEWGPYVQAMIP